MPDGGDKERRILVAVDEGDESLHALSWCLDNVANSSDTIVLLYAREPRLVYSAMDGTGYLFSSDIVAAVERFVQEVADCVVEKAKRLCREAASCRAVKVETRVETGDPRDVICQAVEKLGIDMVVMGSHGSHGYGLIKRAFLGSVSNYCAQNVKCPVLIVKRPKSKSQAK